MIKKIINIVLQFFSLVIPKDEKLIIFGAFSGKRYGDNSAFLFEYIIKEQTDYKPYWISHKKDVVDFVINKGFPALNRYSLKAFWYSVRAKYIVGSHNIKDASMHKVISPNQFFIYLHHGIPLRKGWFDVAGAPKKSLQSSKDKINHSSFMIATSEYAAEQQNKLLPIGLDKFRITGLPRNDVFFKELNSYEKKLINSHIPPNKTTVLYAPTWREWEATKFFPFEDRNLSELNKKLVELNTILILRPHHIDLEKKEFNVLRDEIASFSNIKLITHNEIADINLVCKFSDILITDYSSLIYDFLIINKPIVYFTYDFEKYMDRVGFYPNMQEIVNTGYQPKTQVEFIKSVEEIIEKKDRFEENRMSLSNKLHKYKDSKSCNRVFNEMIKL